MKAWGALGTALNIASAILGGGSSKRQIILSCETEKVTLPVTPRVYEVSTGQGNKVVNVEQVGEALVFGLPQAQRISFQCFFPASVHDYPLRSWGCPRTVFFRRKTKEVEGKQKACQNHYH